MISNKDSSSNRPTVQYSHPGQGTDQYLCELTAGLLYGALVHLLCFGLHHFLQHLIQLRLHSLQLINLALQLLQFLKLSAVCHPV